MRNKITDLFLQITFGISLVTPVICFLKDYQNLCEECIKKSRFEARLFPEIIASVIKLALLKAHSLPGFLSSKFTCTSKVCVLPSHEEPLKLQDSPEPSLLATVSTPP